MNTQLTRRRSAIALTVILLLFVLSLSACQKSPPPEPPHFTAICGSTIMVAGNLYRLEDQENILISAIHPSGIASVSYRIGDGKLITIDSSGSSVIRLPEELSGSGIFSLNVTVTAQDGNQATWAQYLLTTTTLPQISLYYQEKRLEPDTEYTIPKDAILIYTASHAQGIAAVSYRLGDSPLIIQQQEKGEIVLPENFLTRGDFSLNLQGEAKNGAKSPWQQFLFVIE